MGLIECCRVDIEYQDNEAYQQQRNNCHGINYVQSSSVIPSPIFEPNSTRQAAVPRRQGYEWIQRTQACQYSTPSLFLACFKKYSARTSFRAVRHNEGRRSAVAPIVSISTVATSLLQQTHCFASDDIIVAEPPSTLYFRYQQREMNLSAAIARDEMFRHLLPPIVPWNVTCSVQNSSTCRRHAAMISSQV